MNKLQWKVFSSFAILALLLALCPGGRVSAAPGEGTISGQLIMPLPGDPNANFNIDANPLHGGPGDCHGNVTSSDYATDRYLYTVTGCDNSIDYTVTASGWGYTFNPVTVYSAAFSGDPPTANAPSITPVSRAFSGHVFRPDGDGWAGMEVDYTLDGTPGSATTDGSGLYVIPGATDASTLDIPDIYMDGYNFQGGWTFNPPWNGDASNYDFKSTGYRNINGYIETKNSAQGCQAGVTITVSAPNALTQTALTGGDGSWNMITLEPLSSYVVTPSRPGCVFIPASQSIDVTNGDRNQPIVFDIPSTGVYGTVSTTLGSATNFVSLAYYLIATYTTPDGVSYSNSVNWTNGGYWIQVPPNAGGTLSISRMGGPAAFGYGDAGATKTGITLTNQWVEEDFTLTPNRTISGMITDPNGVPVQKNATVDFGYGLHWTQSNLPMGIYSINAQPKLYYLSPVENGLLSSSPVRFLANLTSAPSVIHANFTINLQSYLLDGCLHTNDNDYLVLAAGSVHFVPAPAYGSLLYQFNLNASGMDANYNQRCGPRDTYFSIRLPQGIAGSVVADNHTVYGNNGGTTIDGMNWDKGQDYTLLGNRSITGRIYAPIQTIYNFNNADYSGNGFLVLRDAASNDIVPAPGETQSSYEFSIPQLEAKAYTLSVNQDQVPDGYVAQPFPMDPIVPVNLTAGDVDIPALSGFVLTHAPILPADYSRPATGGGYFIAIGSYQEVKWNYPSSMNKNDWNGFKGFELQVGPAITPFTDTSPAPMMLLPNGYSDPTALSYDPNTPAHLFSGLTNSTLYRWHVRAVYVADKGPWLITAPAPTGPANNYGYPYPIFSSTAGPVTFTWNALNPANFYGTTPKYVVQYSTTLTFTSPIVLTTGTGATSISTSVNPAIGTTYYWRVKAQNSAGVDISDWSPVQTFFNRYRSLDTVFFHRETTFGDPEPIRFDATNRNASLPADAYYQVRFSTDPAIPGDNYSQFTFTTTATGTTPSARQYLNSLGNGTYYWEIAIVNGNDHYATPITGWTAGVGTFSVP